MKSRRPIRFLAIEGADGVGKSTVLRLLLPELVRSSGFSGYAFFHWKPIPGSLHFDEIPADNPHDPRAKAPRPTLLSLMFLARHWSQYLIGYWRRVRPALRTGRLVVADRYTYDVVLDPARFRLRLPACVLRFFVRTLPRPDAVLLLAAPPAVIHARKPELTVEEIDAYQAKLQACHLFRGPVLVDASGTPSQVVSAALKVLTPL